MEALAQEIEDHHEAADGEASGVGETLDVQHIRLGSRQPPQPISAVVDQHTMQAQGNSSGYSIPPRNAFNNFHTRLSTHLTQFFHDYNIPLPDGKPIKIPVGQLVS